MARELRVSEELLLALAHENVRTRTVRQLLAFLADTGMGLESGAAVTVPLLRRELAQMVGTSPETLSRVLHRLAREGALRLTRSGIWVQNPRRLRAILGDRA
ncbi:winged helix-turn-helix domain-containing protein [bacterium]|nr:winged helix-turn-helix domain-containing protein [bacterium]